MQVAKVMNFKDSCQKKSKFYVFEVFECLELDDYTIFSKLCIFYVMANF